MAATNTVTIMQMFGNSFTELNATNDSIPTKYVISIYINTTYRKVTLI